MQAIIKKAKMLELINESMGLYIQRFEVRFGVKSECKVYMNEAKKYLKNSGIPGLKINFKSGLRLNG